MWRTGNDRQSAPEVGQAHFGYIQAVNKDPSGSSFNEAEERQCQGTLSRSGATKNPNLLR